MKIYFPICCALLALCCAAGCYNTREVNEFLQKPRSPVNGLEYRVLPPDVIQITSRHIPEINNITQQIRPDGKINLPLLGEIYVAQKTPAEIEKILAQASKDYYEQVDATVNIIGYYSQKFFVFGEVARPGPEAWTGHDTLLDVLARAQPTFLAWPERIILVRGDQPQEGGREVSQEDAKKTKTRARGIQPDQPGNERREITVNMMAMVRTGDLTNNVLLRPNDVIYVQPNPLAVVGLALQSLLFPVRPAIEAVTSPYQVRNYTQATGTGR